MSARNRPSKSSARVMLGPQMSILSSASDKRNRSRDGCEASQRTDSQATPDREKGPLKWTPPTDGRAAKRRSAKMRIFLCAPCKSLRTFEENLGVFQDAHFSKTV